MFKTFFVQLIQSFLSYILLRLPSPKLVGTPIKVEKPAPAPIPPPVEWLEKAPPELRKELFKMFQDATVTLEPDAEVTYKIHDRFKRIRGFLKRNIKLCEAYMKRARDRAYVESLMTATCDEYGILMFPMNIPDRDTCFYRWNRMAGTSGTSESKLLRATDIDRAIDEMTQNVTDRSQIVKRLKSAKAKLKKSDRFAYDVRADRIVERW